MARQRPKRPPLPDPIARFVEAVNRGDSKSFLSFFPEDGVVDDEGRRFVGHDAIRGWSDREFIGAKGKMTVNGVKRAKGGINVTVDWVSKSFTGPSRFVFVLKRGQVQEMRISSA